MNQENQQNFINNKAKLKWACRRGMLELDVLLANFLEKSYSQLSDEEKHLFIRLLNCSDPEIFAWLMGHETPVDPDLLKITHIIRRHARSAI